MSFPTPTSQSKATQRAYYSEMRRLLKKTSALHIVASSSEACIRLIEGLLADRPNLSASTFRLRKAAVLFALDGLVAKSPEKYDADALEAMARLQSSTSTGCRKKGEHTSAKKARKISAKDFAAIRGRLIAQVPHASRAKPTLAAATLLSLTGMRPGELLGLDLESLPGNRIRVGIRSAKTTNGRGLGDVRHLLLADISEEEKALIMFWSEYLASRPDNTAATTLSGLKAYFRRAAEAALGPRATYPSFYAFRHQAAADMKSAGYTPEEVAAALGHGSSRTATVHYGRKSAGCGSARVSPDPNLVSQVRATATTFDPSRSREAKPKPGMN